jgi:hypothetical protein
MRELVFTTTFLFQIHPRRLIRWRQYANKNPTRMEPPFASCANYALLSPAMKNRLPKFEKSKANWLFLPVKRLCLFQQLPSQPFVWPVFLPTLVNFEWKCKVFTKFSSLTKHDCSMQLRSLTSHFL